MSADNSLLAQIANPTPVKLADPMEAYSKFLMASHLQSEIAKEKQEAGVQNALIRAGQDPSVFDDKGLMDHTKYMHLAGQFGAGPALGKLALDHSSMTKNVAETFMNQRKGEDFQAGTVLKTTDTFHKMLGDVSADPKLGLGQYVSHATQYLGSPAMMEFIKSSGNNPDTVFQEMKTAATKAAMAGPVEWKKFISGNQEGFTKAFGQTSTTINTGNAQNIVSQDYFGGAPQVLGKMDIQRTQGEKLEARKLDLEAAKTQYTQLDDGASKRIVGMPVYGGVNGTVPGTEVQMQQTPDQLAKPGQAVTTKAGQTFLDAHTQVREFPTIVRHMHDALDLLRPDRALTGAGAKRLLNIQRWEKTLGIPISNEETPGRTEYLNKKLNEFILDNLKTGPSSARTTNMITRLTENSNAGIEMQPDAIRDVIKSKLQDMQDQIKKHNLDATNLTNDPQLGPRLKSMGIGEVPDLPKYIPSDAIEHLKADLKAGKDKATAMRQFDEAAGEPGAALRVLGGSSNGHSPLPTAP